MKLKSQKIEWYTRTYIHRLQRRPATARATDTDTDTDTATDTDADTHIAREREAGE